jgi:transketolase
MKFDKIAVNALRGLSLDMITKANSGHPGICLSSAPLVYTLFSRHLIADPNDPNWFNRDRFVLSAGHGSALLYSLLHLCGYSIPLDQLKQFRQIDSLTPGHPEVGHTPGVDATAGPLGQGIAQAVGMAMAEAHLASIYPDGKRLVNHYTYCLCGDGCLEEGISQEAISIAGLQKLNKLVLLYDRNDCTLDGPLTNSSIEDVKGRFEAANWNVLLVRDGNDVDEIDRAITLAKQAIEKPTIIICHTIIGYGSSLAGKNASHGKPFSPEEVVKTKENLGYNYGPFEIPQEAYDAFKETFIDRGHKAHQDYNQACLAYEKDHPNDYHRFNDLMNNDVKKYLFTNAPTYEPNYKESTRNESHAFLELISTEIPNLFGGAADVASSVKTSIKSFTDFTPANRKGQNINFGIREFAMASIQNGILLHGGLRTYVGSFLVFSDYMKAAIRMAAMEKLPAIYLFSHDSIAVGEDGPTHQPIEQLTTLRSIPGLTVYRPADAIETSASYNVAFSSTSRPTAIILSRQGLVNNPGSSFEGAKNGGYVISREKNQAILTLIATGSEVNKAIEIQKALLSEGIDTRVVSLPCFDRFDKLNPTIQDEIFSLPYDKRVFIEMGKTDGLYKYAKYALGIDDYGSSGPADEVIAKYRFTTKDLTDKILDILRHNSK